MASFYVSKLSKFVMHFPCKGIKCLEMPNIKLRVVVFGSFCVKISLYDSYIKILVILVTKKLSIYMYMGIINLFVKQKFKIVIFVQFMTLKKPNSTKITKNVQTKLSYKNFIIRRYMLY